MKLFPFFLLLILCNSTLIGMEKAADLSAKRANPDKTEAAASEQVEDAIEPATKKARPDEKDKLTLLHLLMALNRTDLEKSLQETIPLNGQNLLDAQHLKTLVAQLSMAQTLLADHVTKHRMQNCHITCNPAPELLAKLTSPGISQQRELQTLTNSAQQEITLERRTAKLSGTLDSIIEELDENLPIPVNLRYPGSLDCIIECLKKITKLGACENYGTMLHNELKPLIADTNILHLFETASYLNIPVLFNYLAAYITTYISQETDMKKLGSFLEACSTILPKDLQSSIAEKLLLLHRGTFMQLLYKSNEIPIGSPIRSGEISERAISTSQLRPDSPFVITIHPISDEGFYTFMVYEFKEDAFTLTKSLEIPLKGVKHVIVNRNATALFFTRKSARSISLHSLDFLKVSLNPARQGCGTISRTLCGETLDPNFINTTKVKSSGFVNFRTAPELGIFMSREGNRTTIGDPDYSKPLVFQGFLVAYNGTHALTLDEESDEKPVVLWAIADDGSITQLKNIFLPSDLSWPELTSKDEEDLANIYYFLSPSGKSIVHNLYESDTQENNEGSKIIFSEEQLEYRRGDLVACCDSKLMVQKKSDRFTLIDTQIPCKPSTLLPSYPALTLAWRAGAAYGYYNPRSESVHSIRFFNNDTRICMVFSRTESITEPDPIHTFLGQQIHRTIPVINLRALIVDLFEEAKKLTLTQLACLLNSKRVSENAYLQTEYAKIPEHVRARNANQSEICVFKMAEL